MRGKIEMDEDEKGKLFVGGLSWETTQEALQRYFQRYGDVVDCVVMKNTDSGRSRGFGFVTFADPANVNLVLSSGPHVLDGRTIDPKPCNPRTLSKPKRSNGFPKVFLGGLPSNVTETDLRTFFMRYGKVMEVVIMYDQEKKKSRGFGFLSFEDEESVERCVCEHFVNLNGKQVEIKKAEPRDVSGKMNDGANTWGAPAGAQMGMGGGMGMGGPNGQMSGPMGGLGHMPPGNMMGGYQGWGTPPASAGYPGQWGSSNPSAMNGYGTPSGGYQQWGAPPGPQSQQMPPQWGSNYPSQGQGYGSYGPPQSHQSGYNNSWNWNMPQGSGGAPQGGPGPNQAGPQGDIYSRSASAGAPGSAGTVPPGTGPNPKTPDYTYGNYGAYSQDSSSYGAQGRSYGAEATSASGNGTPGYPSHPPIPGQEPAYTSPKDDPEPILKMSFKQYLEKAQNSPVFSTNMTQLSLDQSSSSEDYSWPNSHRDYARRSSSGRSGKRSEGEPSSSYHPYRR